jgi:hypothetical protein
MSLLRACMELELPGTDKGQYGCDIAREGDDRSVIARCRGGVIRTVKVLPKQDTMQTAGAIAQILRLRGDVSAQVDADGLGAGPFDRLREQGLPVIEFRAAHKAIEADRFVNRKAEMFWSLRERMEDGEIDLPPEGEDDDMIAQLGSLRYFIDSRGRIGIESKQDMKKRGLPSPDHADAAAMSSIPAGGIATPMSGGSAAGDNFLTKEW